MKIAVLGSTGQAGSEVVRQALEAGHDARACARRDAGIPAGARKVIGELDDQAALRRAIAGADAVISVLGPRSEWIRRRPLIRGVVSAPIAHGRRELPT
ncbi:MAG: NAD(P)H-binding protein [Myxococcota bacterium]|nr:NAD(P)H-binding protein [Myxococcota bacterium]